LRFSRLGPTFRRMGGVVAVECEMIGAGSDCRGLATLARGVVPIEDCRR
jgi:hypothetical protein